MAEIVPLRVQLIAKTDFIAPPDIDWSTDADGGPALVEFAGRACYQSWSKPNPRTATNESYLRHVIEVGHLSVLEHASATFYITGISRSCTHELIRHRHFSYSQLSQRFVPEDDSNVVLPPAVEDDPELVALVRKATDASRAAYVELLEKLESTLADVPNAVLRRKQARQARPVRAAQRYGDQDRRHRELPGLATLHRDEGQRTRRRGDSSARHCLSAPARRPGSVHLRRFRYRDPGRRTEVAISPLVYEG
ncbi:thymidylate synthase, flavin-dependent [Mycobacteroides abscessus]|nr:thymidylate synthase, flavin-dependent [Mycobacteroides abscessus]